MSEVITNADAFAVLEEAMARTGKKLDEVSLMISALILDHTKMDRLVVKMDLPGKGKFSVTIKRLSSRRK